MTKFLNLKPFVPSGEDFDLAIEFFKTLGFKENWSNPEHGLMELQLDEACFILQKYANQELQENLMMSIEVSDLDAYWKSMQESGVLSMKGVKAKPPTDYPWGKREIHLIDPAGVFWHLLQANED